MNPCCEVCVCAVERMRVWLSVYYAIVQQASFVRWIDLMVEFWNIVRCFRYECHLTIGAQ